MPDTVAHRRRIAFSWSSRGARIAAPRGSASGRVARGLTAAFASARRALWRALWRAAGAWLAANAANPRSGPPWTACVDAGDAPGGTRAARDGPS